MHFIDHHKWLVDNNLLTDEIRDNVAMAAYCIVENVENAHTKIDFNESTVHYMIVLPEQLFNNIKLLERYEKTKDIGFFEMMRLKKFLKIKNESDDMKMGYKLEDIANKFVRGYLNDKWKATVKIVSSKNYDASKDPWLHSQGDSISN